MIYVYYHNLVFLMGIKNAVVSDSHSPYGLFSVDHINKLFAPLRKRFNQQSLCLFCNLSPQFPRRQRVEEFDGRRSKSKPQERHLFRQPFPELSFQQFSSQK
jgi:hypothetical protein